MTYRISSLFLSIYESTRRILLGGFCGYMGIRDDGLIHRMSDAMSHRGSEFRYHYCHGEYAFGSRERRSPNDQADKKNINYFIAFDGEIINRTAIIKNILEPFNTSENQNDAELIRLLYKQHGIGFIDMMAGEFSFLIWDENEQRLILYRDLSGSSPVFYHISQETLVFASSVKAVLCAPNISKELDPAALRSYLNSGYVEGERTLYKNIRILPPGYSMIYKNNAVRLVSNRTDNKNSYTFGNLTEWAEEFINESKTAFERCTHSIRKAGFITGIGSGGRVLEALMSNKPDINATFFSHRFLASINTKESMASEIGEKFNSFNITPDDIQNLPSIISTMETPVADVNIIGYDVSAENAVRGFETVVTDLGFNELLGLFSQFNLLLAIIRFLRSSNRVFAGISEILSYAFPSMIFGKQLMQSGLDVSQLKNRISEISVANKHGDISRSPLIIFTRKQIDELLHENYRHYDFDEEHDVNERGIIDCSSLIFNYMRNYSYTLVQSKCAAISDFISNKYNLSVRNPFFDKKLFSLSKYFLKNHSVDDLSHAENVIAGLLTSDTPIEFANQLGPFTFADVRQRDKTSTILNNTLNDFMNTYADVFDNDTIIKIKNNERSILSFSQIYSLITLQLWLDTH